LAVLGVRSRSHSYLLAVDVADRRLAGADDVGRCVYAVFAAFTVLVALADLGDVAVAPC